jgi:3-methyladenine DNA glycosylase/8-oxoguanine DNA glycosylase
MHVHDPLGKRQTEFYGPGATWLSSTVDDLFGNHDEPPSIAPAHDVVHLLQKQFGALRLGRSHTPFHEILPAILGQRVTTQEAAQQWSRIVRNHGEKAPGPHPTLLLPPSPEVLAKIPYTTFHTYGIDRRRADTLRHAGRLGHYLVRDWDRTVDPSQHTEALMHLPGVGPWTAAVAGALAFGDPDAIAVGDFHLKNTIAWALHKKPRGTDDEMLASLSPYVGQRQRIVRWIQMAGISAPARGPRRPIVSITHL